MTSPQTGPLVDPTELPEWLRTLVERTAELKHEHLGWSATVPGEAREAAVLILFGDGEAGPDVLLIRRADGLNSHPGQVAFPGGAIDPEDTGVVDAALREAVEEVGLTRDGVRPIATMPELHLGRSGFRVNPVLAYWRDPCEVSPVDVGETAAVARVPISWLTDPSNRLQVGVGRHTTPAFLVPGMLVWGFTGALLSGVLDLAGWSRKWDRDDVRGLDEAWSAAERAGDAGFVR